MKTTAFDTVIAVAVEDCVMKIFGCERHNIIQYIDSEVKKVVVFILHHHFGYNKRLIGWNYRMTHWYVPTACEEIKVIYDHDILFKDKVDAVLNDVRNLKFAV